MTNYSTMHRRVHWGHWWRWPPRLKTCDGCGVTAACWWVDGQRRTVTWRCIHCLPHLRTKDGGQWHDPLNPFAPQPWTEEQVLAHIAALEVSP